MPMTGEPFPSVAAAWDAEYAAGRYVGEPPVAFTRDILAAARQAGLTRGLYIGCGNGRNYLPLVVGGLDLTGLDISATAIAQLSARAPGRLVHGDLSELPATAAYPPVIGIQVFQHGDRAAAHAHIRAAHFLAILAEAALRLAERGRITAEDAARWTVLDNQTIIWRGQELVDTGPVVAFAEILTEIIHGGYPEPPPGHAWFFGLPEVSTIRYLPLMPSK
jgi:SAM-dependent methyltransferase